MKAQELRIGNWVFDIKIHKEKEVYPITIINCKLNPNNFLPIPLTEEWKIRLGFDENNCIGIYLDSGSAWTLQVTKQGNEILIYSQEGELTCCLGRVEYVHHLQNLYLDLTGQELKIK